MPKSKFRYGLTDQGALTVEATRPCCPTHPNGKSLFGFGYAGGGFGPYRICNETIDCDEIFDKVDMSK